MYVYIGLRVFLGVKNRVKNAFQRLKNTKLASDGFFGYFQVIVSGNITSLALQNGSVTPKNPCNKFY